MATKKTTTAKVSEEIKVKTAKKRVLAKVEDNKEVIMLEKPTSNEKPSKVATKKAAPSKSKQPVAIKITFRLRYSTNFGQTIFLSGNHPLLGNEVLESAVPLSYLNKDFWEVTLIIDNPANINQEIKYNYLLKNPDGTIIYDCGTDKTVNPFTLKCEHTLIIDSWNHAGYFENAFYTEPFQQVFLKPNYANVKTKSPSKYTHIFRAKAPLLTKGQTLCLLGSCDNVGNWLPENALLMTKEEKGVYFEVKLLLNEKLQSLEYKYGVYDVEAKEFCCFEEGKNRIIHFNTSEKSLTILNDGFAVLPSNTWKGAGVAIPVFSLRSNQSFGVGEFTDIPALVDWCKKINLKLVQLLPVNDTIATNTWVDSYPYSAISAFALHPIYLNLAQVASIAASKTLVEGYESEKVLLNGFTEVDYEEVMYAKRTIIKQLFVIEKQGAFKTTGYKKFFELNKHWLRPYACFCYLRDIYGTAEIAAWKSHNQYNEEEVDRLIDEKSNCYDDISIHYFIQYHLHLQLKAAKDYAHKQGIVIKGDIAIGVSPNSADVWQHPDLFNMEFQAGAPPDDFAVKGQNWGFPTYNWEHMKQDGFAWWKQRFEQMTHYFDAFRIDHILGFFRIWSVPYTEVEGIMGHFVPAKTLHINELREKGIWYDYKRFTQPYINDNVLWEHFGYDSEFVKDTFLMANEDGNYFLKKEVNTQRNVERHFISWKVDDFYYKIKQGLFDLISNVILFEVDGSNGQEFHFRFNINNTSSYKFLDEHTRWQLNELYVNYFFRRQDDFWRKEALQKLPALKRVTNMLVCGEDLGLVPDCVPDVMEQLGILSLEIQRMPKDSSKPFFHPHQAPYLSVVTPSTHDMSTIRGWWEEDKEITQRFFNYELDFGGVAPKHCEAWINKAIVEQHLQSPAMWSVFQLQDILGCDESIRRENPTEERINVPANPRNYWRYRMHISLEDLVELEDFNLNMATMVKETGRG